MMRNGGRLNRKSKSLQSFSPPKIGTFGDIDAVLVGLKNGVSQTQVFEQMKKTYSSDYKIAI